MMIGRDWPFHEAKISGDTGRALDFLTTSPAMGGSASVALDMQVWPASARHPVASLDEEVTATVPGEEWES